MQPAITRREENTNYHRQIRFLFDGRTIVTMSKLRRSTEDFEAGQTEIFWTVSSGKPAEFAAALGTALLEAAAIARAWDGGAGEEGQ